MAMPIFDTLKVYKRLKEAGVPSAQAEAKVEVCTEIFSIDWKELLELLAEEGSPAVKEGLQRELSDLRKDMGLKFEQAISTLRGEILSLRNDLRRQNI